MSNKTVIRRIAESGTWHVLTLPFSPPCHIHVGDSQTPDEMVSLADLLVALELDLTALSQIFVSNDAEYYYIDKDKRTVQPTVKAYENLLACCIFIKELWQSLSCLTRKVIKVHRKDPVGWEGELICTYYPTGVFQMPGSGVMHSQ
ncbi:MAG: hypothetical protein COU21_00790 [Candidatus Komeilibacteria bacterium CG10_big_fil_rev_8_21_14_0_10_36_65]|nr:MAG: hypothetical protein COU21_00790 [Candidatus Komeilibacteria bacterium CG10_big_fil_rev_8_21_14_0_10_36_65]PJC55767.1 MAG: hypothetical protein CO027_00395 [Candidatus Komeilibacteria bacterium CG_4_9_14_0_2_um_filter_36_13]